MEFDTNHTTASVYQHKATVNPRVRD